MTAAGSTASFRDDATSSADSIWSRYSHMFISLGEYTADAR